ncbi:MAG: DUF6120 family protein [Acetobacter sp.]|nr:DUF6120 family protein [Bacteroides sp.]MCM1341095.1 DUF6120 family protein [Acetobacter sp.]MCM1433572.1 DUF6120 family protein [Clostridiales bacterium]
MDKKLDKAIKKYLKEVKSLIICNSKSKRDFMKKYKESIYDYVESNDISTVDKFQENFGDPETIAKAFFADADLKEIKKKLNVKRIILGLIIGILIIWGVFVSLVIFDSYDETHGYFVNEPAVIIEESDADMI